MPFITPPQVPNFTPGVGRLATGRYTFENHIDGYSFRHVANQIDLFPTVVIDGYTCTNVQSAISVLGSLINPVIPNATTTSPGLITLAGDIAGTFNNVNVVGLRGRGIVNTAPTTGQVLQFNGTNWAPATLPAVVSLIAGFSISHTGLFSWTAPAGVTSVLLIGFGGGGSGGGGSSALTNSGAGGGGGQGGIQSSIYTAVTPGVTYTITVPSVAFGGASDGNGTAGGTVSFVGTDGIQVYFAGGAAGLGGNFAQYPVPGIGGGLPFAPSNSTLFNELIFNGSPAGGGNGGCPTATTTGVGGFANPVQTFVTSSSGGAQGTTSTNPGGCGGGGGGSGPSAEGGNGGAGGAGTAGAAGSPQTGHAGSGAGSTGGAGGGGGGGGGGNSTSASGGSGGAGGPGGLTVLYVA